MHLIYLTYQQQSLTKPTLNVLRTLALCHMGGIMEHTETQQAPSLTPVITNLPGRCSSQSLSSILREECTAYRQPGERLEFKAVSTGCLLFLNHCRVLKNYKNFKSKISWGPFVMPNFSSKHSTGGYAHQQ